MKCFYEFIDIMDEQVDCDCCDICGQNISSFYGHICLEELRSRLIYIGRQYSDLYEVNDNHFHQTSDTSAKYKHKLFDKQPIDVSF